MRLGEFRAVSLSYPPERGADIRGLISTLVLVEVNDWFFSRPVLRFQNIRNSFIHRREVLICDISAPVMKNDGFLRSRELPLELVDTIFIACRSAAQIKRQRMIWFEAFIDIATFCEEILLIDFSEITPCRNQSQF